MLAFQIGFRDWQMLGLALGKHLFLQSALFVFPLYMNTFIFFLDDLILTEMAFLVVVLCVMDLLHYCIYLQRL